MKSVFHSHSMKLFLQLPPVQMTDSTDSLSQHQAPAQTPQ